MKDTTPSTHNFPGITLCTSLRSFLASCQWRPRFQHSVWASVPHPSRTAVQGTCQCPHGTALPSTGCISLPGEWGTHAEFSVHNLNLYGMLVQTFPEPKQGATDQKRKEVREHQVLTGAESLDHLKPCWTFSADGKDEELHNATALYSSFTLKSFYWACFSSSELCFWCYTKASSRDKTIKITLSMVCGIYTDPK